MTVQQPHGGSNSLDHSSSWCLVEGKEKHDGMKKQDVIAAQ